MAASVRVPRCEACRNRNWIENFLVITGFAVGMGFSLPGWTAAIGTVVGLVLTGFGILLYARLSVKGLSLK